jgi:ribosomal protein S18 acetylase RimI-like enzyme
MHAIRTTRAEDLDAVVALWRDAGSPHGATAEREGVDRLVRTDPEALLVAEIDGRVVGAVIAAWDGWRGNMYRLAVDPEHRRDGIGLALVRTGEERLRARGARRVTALVASDDPRAQGLWSAAGYRADGVHGRLVRDL